MYCMRKAFWATSCCLRASHLVLLLVLLQVRLVLVLLLLVLLLLVLLLLVLLLLVLLLLVLVDGQALRLPQTVTLTCCIVNCKCGFKRDFEP